jgi:hypothetical protein
VRVARCAGRQERHSRRPRAVAAPEWGNRWIALSSWIAAERGDLTVTCRAEAVAPVGGGGSRAAAGLPVWGAGESSVALAVSRMFASVECCGAECRVAAAVTLPVVPHGGSR